MRVRLHLIILIFIAISASVICGCDNGEKSIFHNIPPEGWAYGDTLYFKVSDADSTSITTGDIIVVIRHSNAYEFSNIWLNLRYFTEDTLVNDTVNLRLADDYGNWYGKGMGVSYQRTDTVARHVSIDASRPIKAWHIMRADTLPDIEQVGVIFTTTNNQK